MRRTIQDKDGQWRMYEEVQGICRLLPIDWTKDRNGYWPQAEKIVDHLDVPLSCPSCGEMLLFNEIEYVFGVCRREKTDVIFLVNCLHCKLPIRVRVHGFMSRYPAIAKDMEGWENWDVRRKVFEAEEEKLYGKK